MTSGQLTSDIDCDDRPMSERRLGFVAFAGIFGILVARIAALSFSGTEFFADEAQYWSWSKELAFGYYSKPPLIAWLIAAQTALCGDGEVCVRTLSPLIHSGTALFIYLIGAELYTARVGILSALAFVLLPAVTVSSNVISTDVPLLFFWAGAVWALLRLQSTQSLTWALVLGVMLGLGLNAKYAMAYIVPCLIALWFVPAWRRTVFTPLLGLSLIIALFMIGPNAYWNATHGFATLLHTSDNASWRGNLLHPLKAAEFIATQFGVFGPVYFAVLTNFVWRAATRRASLHSSDAFLLALSVPILAIVAAQALISHALANWAAPAYVAATVLITAVLVREDRWRLLASSLGIGLLIFCISALAFAWAGKFVLPGGIDPFKRTIGYEAITSSAREWAKTEGGPYRVDAIAADERGVLAALIYYGRDIALPVYALPEGATPSNHFELTRACCGRAAHPMLVTLRSPEGLQLPKPWTGILFGIRDVPAGIAHTRRIYFYILGRNSQE